MGKRRSQMRQNADFERLGSAPQQSGAAPSDSSASLAAGSGGTLRSVSPARVAPRGPVRNGPAPGDTAFANAAPRGLSASRAREQFRDQLEWLEDNPLVLTLGGVALGVLGGLLLPVSDAETQRLSAVGDNIADQVQTHVQAIGQDVVEHGKAVLVETLQATVVDGKSPVGAVQQSVQDHLVTVAQNAQERVEASLGLNQHDA